MTNFVTPATTSDPYLGAADLQIHTSLSDGMASPAEVVEAAVRAGLDLIAVTDHEDLRGGMQAREIAARTNAPITVLPGIEITTRSGHLLAIGLEAPVPSFRSLRTTIELVKAQGGLCIVPHPLAWAPLSLSSRAISTMVASLDGIELANPTPSARWRQSRARRHNRDRWKLAETGGSDAHFPEMIGTAVTRFPGRTAADLRAALAAHTTIAELRAAPSLREIGARRLAQQMGRGLLATPRATARTVTRHVTRSITGARNTP